MLVVGTSGHIDHGKSAIVKRLTGTDPDRLPEEKARGLTIDLGFAFRRLAGSESVAYVDVPGHERFVKNMIAGAAGIDVVMLVVAADDGWMPQSEEHFQIVKLLGIKHGLVVINKCDLAETDWIDLLEEDIRSRLRGSFLETAPVFRVSAQTGEGFDRLTAYLDQLPQQIHLDRDIGPARLYIDRSFVLLGIGGVVTGTLRDGPLQVGQTVGVWPSRVTGKIRSLHANNREVTLAQPGQRVAVSFSGIDKDLLVRGGVVTTRDDLSYFAENPLLALRIQILDGAQVDLVDRRRLILITGTTEVEGEARLVGVKKIARGQEGIILFRPDEPVLALVGDSFIVRLPTPMVTLGGGEALDRLPRLPMRRDATALTYLKSRRSLTVEDLVLSELARRILVPEAELLSHAAVASKRVRATVARFVKEDRIGRYQGLLYEQATLEGAVAALTEGIADFLKENPHLKGLPRERLQQLSPFAAETTTTLISYLVEQGTLVKLGDQLNLVGRGMALKGKVREAHDGIMASLHEQPFTPPRLTDLGKQSKEHREAIKFILETGEGYKCGSDFLFLKESWIDLLRFVKGHLAIKPSMSVTDLKDRFGITRKFAIPILEETDRLGLTARAGDVRVKGERYETPQFNL